MKVNWHFQHKWSGLVCCLLLSVFCLSGVLLNHRGFSEGVDVSRRFLPPFYRHHSWNGGLLRGSQPLGHGRVAVYGTSGMFVADSGASTFRDFNAGLPAASARRNVRAMGADSAGNLYALTPGALYFRSSGAPGWRLLAQCPAGDRFSDLVVDGGRPVVLGRSYLYTPDSSACGARLRPMVLRTSDDGHLDRTTAFRVVWMLHSGELFGLPGRLVVDFIALAFIALCITGGCIWLLPKMKRPKVGPYARLHRKVGVWGMVFFALVALTGWMLRPPLMVPLAMWEVPEPAGTQLHAPGNPWHDKLRMLRHDAATGSWLLSTSRGFYSAAAPDSVFRPLESAPPVSVMGLNVWLPDGPGRWLCGSFSGLYRWDVVSGRCEDYFTGEEPAAKAGPPVGRHKVCGMSRDFGSDMVVLYDEGTPSLPQPPEMATMPMSLWNVALEAHSGRIYFGQSATWFFIFVAGALVLWCLYSGWKARGGRPASRRGSSSEGMPARSSWRKSSGRNPAS